MIYMNIGDVSGCLEVIGNCDDVELEIQDLVRTWAENEWNKFSDWNAYFYSGNFGTYYKLTNDEIELHDAKGAMPESFVRKFRGNGEGDLSYENHFLYHKKRPNTYGDLVDGYKEGKLYKVKCKICNRIFYIDSVSFNCIKWKSCIGADCLACTVDDCGADYMHSLYDWNSNSNKLQVLDYQLSKVEALSNPLTYYSSDEALHIAYISDLHLLHHLKYYNGNAKKMIKDMVDKLYASMSIADIVIFGGDISSDTDMTLAFFTYFMRKYDYIYFQKFKTELCYLKKLKKALSNSKIPIYLDKCDKINRYIEELKKALLDSFDFTMFEKYKKLYRSYESYETAFEYYRKITSYKKYNISEEDEERILQIAKLIDFRDKYNNWVVRYKSNQNRVQNRVDKFEVEYGKAIEDISLNDYRHVMLDGVYAVLGNHEYIDFSNVDACVSFYKTELSKLGIKLLHNNYYLNDRFLIYGGTGFAKYDQKWNADTIVCCSNFSRENEIVETTIFEQGYMNALNYAKENGLCFLCVSHYPVSACLNNVFDKEAIYFTGHNHQNQFIKVSEKVLYADNQIGYKNNNIMFKIATTGYEVNPYGSLADGLYRTTIADYLQFYRYVGEDIGKGNLLYERCQNGKANLYVVKRKGYYGFFIITPKGNAKGISIVNGGVTKKLTNSTDMDWICENFDIVLSKYLQILIPLRNAQEQISEELRELGLDGTIHGCIVDIDFYHHVMLNPIDGSMTFYFSSSFGKVLKLSSFNDVIKSLESHKSIFASYSFDMIQEEFDKKSRDKGYLLGMSSNSYLVETEKDEIMGISQKEEIVSRKDGMYGLSRKVNPMQRLFSGHVLRDFDLRLTETKQQSYRKYLYINRIFSYEGITYKVVKDDGTDIILAEEVQEYSCENCNEIILTGKTRKFAISSLKSKIANKNEYDTYWISM